MLLLSTGCMSTLIKRQKTPEVRNEVPVTVPFTAQKIEPVQVGPEPTKNEVKPTMVSKESMNLVNTIATILGTAVLVVCFLPFILTFFDYLFEQMSKGVKQTIEWYKNRKKD